MRSSVRVFFKTRLGPSNIRLDSDLPAQMLDFHLTTSSRRQPMSRSAPFPLFSFFLSLTATAAAGRLEPAPTGVSICPLPLFFRVCLDRTILDVARHPRASAPRGARSRRWSSFVHASVFDHQIAARLPRASGRRGTRLRGWASSTPWATWPPASPSRAWPCPSSTSSSRPSPSSTVRRQSCCFCGRALHPSSTSSSRPLVFHCEETLLFFLFF